MEQNYIEIIRNFYNNNYETEWNRIGNRPEFLLTCKYLDRYIKKGDNVLDIGGGPGRYSLYLAASGARVTLFDLSEKNIEFALAEAAKNNLSVKSICGDARYADKLTCEKFDHILLMGPMYHLLNETERIEAVNAALNLLKPGGVIFISFIVTFAGIIYMMKLIPELILSQEPIEILFRETILNNNNFSGQAFTQAFFIDQKNIEPFMKQFNLIKLHLIGQESITSPCENNIMNASPEAVEAWLSLAEKLCEREELLSWSEHLMYIAKKPEEK